MRRLALLGYLLLGTTCAAACEPGGVPPKGANEAFLRGPIVFTAKVEKAYLDKYGFPSIADVRIVNYWKGREWLRPNTRVNSDSGPTCPRHTFVEGRTYLIYVQPILPQQVANFRVDGFVDRVLDISKADADLRFLSHHRKYELDK